MSSNTNHSLLMRCCVELLDTFRSDLTSVEDHLRNQLSQVQGLEAEEELFLSEVFSGCVRFAKALDVVLDGFYNREGAFVLRAEQNIYKVLMYLAIIRLDELGFDLFRKFVRTQPIRKMCKFFTFFLDDCHLRSWIKDEWNQMFDVEFVDCTMLQPLLRWLPRLHEMTYKMQETLDKAAESRPSNKRPTVPKPFNITPQKPVLAPMPEPIPQMNELEVVRYRSRPAFKPTDLTDRSSKEPATLAKLERIKADNRRQALNALAETNQNALNVWRTEKSERTKQRMQQIIDEEMSNLHFNGLPRSQQPNLQSLSANYIPIKLNSAVILREGKMYEKQEQEELRKLERLEAGEFDSNTFDEWQTRMKRADLERTKERVELLRLAGQLSKEEAVLAKRAVLLGNREKAVAMKQEADRLMNEYMRKQFIEQERQRKLAENVTTSKHNMRVRKQEMRAYKSSIVQQMKGEQKELMRIALEEAEVEMKRRMELIEQIRVLETKIDGQEEKRKYIDFTETAGYGFLSEMSIAELRERLGLAKQAEAARLEGIRDNILNDKQEKEQILMDKLETISRHREEICKAAAIRFEEKKKTQETKYRRERYRSEAVEEMERKLEGKKRERLREDERVKSALKPQVVEIKARPGECKPKEKSRLYPDSLSFGTPPGEDSVKKNALMKESTNKNYSRVELLAL